MPAARDRRRASGRAAIALASGTAVRTLQESLVTASGGHHAARDTLQRHLAGVIATLPPDPLGTVGVIDETSSVKKGGKTPGVRRPFLGCVGKVDSGIVTVHVGVARGRFRALLDADLYLPRSWDEDRPRREAAGIPDGVHHLPKWRIALDQYLRLHPNGVRFDWLTFDEGSGSKTPLLGRLSMLRQEFVRGARRLLGAGGRGGPPRRADEVLNAEDAKNGRRFRFRRENQADRWWRAKAVTAWADGRAYRPVVAIDQATAEVKYFVTDAAGEPLRLVLAVAFRRATVGHSFRLCKQEAGLMHFEGRYTGLMRHLILSLIVTGFESIHTDRLRGEIRA